MSLELVRKAAAEQTGPYVELPVKVYHAALEETKEPQSPGSFAEHVAGRMRSNPDAAMHAHRDAHLAKLLGAQSPAVVTPAAPTLEA